MSSRDSSSASDSDTENEVAKDKTTPAHDIVVTKYNMAAAVVNAILLELIKKCQPGQSIIQLCEFGDQQIVEKTSQLFKKDKEMKKGIAFPTCISVNNCICHYSPLKSEKDVQLSSGDVVKIDLGAHVDGFVAVAAHTIVIKENSDSQITGRKADVILAAHYALEAAIRMLKPGQYNNNQITEAIQKVAESFKCKPVENMLSHQLKRNKIDGEKQIIQNPGEKQKQDFEKCEFEQYEVYAIDIIISTGEGKSKDLDTRTTVYMKNEDIVYQLKMKASRVFFSDADKRFGSLPFTLRSFDDEVKAKMGIVECERHNLMKPFPVLYEKEGEFVAQMKTTVIIMPNGILKITGLPSTFEPTLLYRSEHKIQDEKISQIIQTSLKPSKKKAKKTNKNNNEGDKKTAPSTTPAAAAATKPKATPKATTPKAKIETPKAKIDGAGDK